MSTGSSEESSGSSEVMSPPALTATTSEAIFVWPNYSINKSPTSSPVSNVIEEHRSVSQIGEPPDWTSETSSSNTAYVKMKITNTTCPDSSDFVIDQESASYINMKMPNVKRLPNANVDVIR